MSFDNSGVIYTSGLTSDDYLLIAGVWTLWSQEGFPLEMSHMVCRDKGWRIDWLEAMCDASRHDDLPSLMGHIESFLDAATLTALKGGFSRWLDRGQSYDDLLAEKRANGTATVDSAVMRSFVDKFCRAV